MNFPHREQLITLCVPAVLLALFYIFMVQPGGNKLNQIRTQHRHLASQSRELNNNYLNYADLYEQVNELKQRLANAKREVPEQDRMARFEEVLVELGKKYNLLDSGRPNGANYLDRPAPHQDGEIVRQDVIIRFTTDALTFYGFLSEIEQLERLTQVTSIDMQPSPEPRQFAVTMGVSIFYGNL